MTDRFDRVDIKVKGKAEDEAEMGMDDLSAFFGVGRVRGISLADDAKTDERIRTQTIEASTLVVIPASLIDEVRAFVEEKVTGQTSLASVS